MFIVSFISLKFLSSIHFWSNDIIYPNDPISRSSCSTRARPAKSNTIWIFLSVPIGVFTIKGGIRKPIARPNKSQMDPIAVAIEISSVLNHLFAERVSQ